MQHLISKSPTAIWRLSGTWFSTTAVTELGGSDRAEIEVALTSRLSELEDRLEQDFAWAKPGSEAQKPMPAVSELSDVRSESSSDDGSKRSTVRSAPIPPLSVTSAEKTRVGWGGGQKLSKK